MMEKEILEIKQEKQREDDKCALCGTPEISKIERGEGDNVCALCGAPEKREEGDDNRKKEKE